MPHLFSSIPQDLGPLVWAPLSLITSKTRRLLVTRRTLTTLIARVALSSLVTTALSSQGRPTQQGGSLFSSWQPVAVLPMQAGLPLCLCHLDPLQLSHLCWNLWEV